jgi:OFA family oxalate/formate antiporter-like MFS transporter
VGALPHLVGLGQGRRPATPHQLCRGRSTTLTLSARRRFYYGWFVTAAASGIEFANAASAIGILTIFVNPMTQEFGWSRTEVAGATSLGAILGAILAPFSGRLVDKMGSRLLLATGGVSVALACFYLAVAQTLLGFYVAFTLSRIADQGLIKIGASTTVGKWFQRYRGRATGLVFFAGSAGIIVLAPIVQLVISTWGWRTAWVMLGIMMFSLGAIPAALIIRRQPEDLGLVLDGVNPSERSSASASSSPRFTQAPPEEEQWLVSQVIRTPAFWLILLSLFVASMATSGVGLHLVPHLTQQGLSAPAAVGAISIMSTTGALGALALGVIAERASPRLMITLAYLLGAVSMMVLIVADTLPETYLFAAIQGIVGSGVNTLAPLLWASYYGRWTLGSIYGLSRAAQVTGFALGPLISGLVYDATGSYQRAFISFAFLAAGSSLLVLTARKPSPTAPSCS